LLHFSVGRANDGYDENHLIAILRERQVRIKLNDKLPQKPAIELEIFSKAAPVNALTAIDYAPIRKLRSLRRIKMSGLAIDDSYLDNVLDLPALTDMELSDTQVQDEGLGQLSHVKKLRVLSMTLNSDLTDRGVRHLGRLENLEELRISESSKITGAGLVGLQRLTKLRTLDLNWCSISDDGVKTLRGHPSLEFLSLIGNQVTDRSLEYIREIPRLRSLYVSDTRVTKAGVVAFRKARPEIRVSDKGLEDD
jgi:Leucine-rich repeat (LRR) protein